MNRSILFSLIAIAVAATVIAVAGTQALFTDTQTASGDVNAGTIDLYLDEGVGDDDNAEDEFIFELTENLLPGETASNPLRLNNTGNRTWEISSITPVITPDAECDADNSGDDWTAAVTGFSVGDAVAPGASQTVSVDVSLASAVDNDCQGDTITVTVTVVVSQP
jgi:predicted ribosomally synthesized peptide with SipW-like signal peptide